MKSNLFNRRREARVTRQAAGTDAFITDNEKKVEEMNTDDVRLPDTKTAGDEMKPVDTAVDAMAAPVVPEVPAAPAPSGEITQDGEFVTLVQTEDNMLRMVPHPDAMAKFVEQNKHHLSDDILLHVNPSWTRPAKRLNVWGDDSTLYELLDDHLQGGWNWIEPHEIGALTAAPILEAPDGRVYWHERYAIESGAEELIKGETVMFDGAPENKPWTPEAPVEPELGDDLGKSASKVAADDAIPPVDPTAPVDPNASSVPAMAEAPADPNPSKYKYWTAEMLSDCIGALSKVTDFDQNKAAQEAVAMMAEELNKRPKMAPEAVKAASGSGSFFVTNEETSEILEGDKSIPDGRDKVEDHTGITRPSTTVPNKLADRKEASFVTNEETSKVLEGDKSIPDGHKDEDDNTGIDRPAMDTPSKFAAGSVSTAQALKLVGTMEDKLKSLYLDAKPITKANDTRPVRDAVEAIYHAMALFSDASKVLSKQSEQERAEENAQEQALHKKKKESALDHDFTPVPAPKRVGLMASLKIATEEAQDEDEGEQKTAAGGKLKMTIQMLAQKQLDQPTTFHFAREGTSDCYWFNHGSVMAYSDADMNGRRVSLDVDDLAATDWRVIRDRKVPQQRQPAAGDEDEGEQKTAAGGSLPNGLLDSIRPGSKVTILVPAGMGRGGQEFKESTGRAVMRGPAGWVLNMGGKHGTPGVATEKNIVAVR